jgi:hypothetical protein
MKSKLIEWDTEFKDTLLPSVGLYVSVINEEYEDNVYAVVAPDGIDEYPKYFINFGYVLAYLCYDESFPPDREWEKIEREKGICSYKWKHSPWVESYSIHYGNTKDEILCHYLIIGADNIIEIVSYNEPLIRKVESKEKHSLELII